MPLPTRYALPASECLKDVLVRMLPYWYDAIVPDLLDRRLVSVSAHRNSLRALVKHLDGIPDDEIAELNLPTGVPLLYELNDQMRPSGRIDPQFGVSGTYLDPRCRNGINHQRQDPRSNSRAGGGE